MPHRSLVINLIAHGSSTNSEIDIENICVIFPVSAGARMDLPAYNMVIRQLLDGANSGGEGLHEVLNIISNLPTSTLIFKVLWFPQDNQQSIITRNGEFRVKAQVLDYEYDLRYYSERVAALNLLNAQEHKIQDIQLIRQNILNIHKVARFSEKSWERLFFKLCQILR